MAQEQHSFTFDIAVEINVEDGVDESLVADAEDELAEAIAGAESTAGQEMPEGIEITSFVVNRS